MEKAEFLRLMKAAGEKLRAAGIDSAEAEVETVLEYLLDADRLNLYLNGEKLIDDSLLEKFHGIIERRTSRYPLQYILGEMYFYGRRFVLTPEAMVPTYETEVLCELAINYIKNEGLKAPRVLDVGVGSGVISVTVASELEDARVTAVDISPGALEVARQNARLHEVDDRIEFIQSDGMEGLEKGRAFNLILSNPPYIAEPDYEGLPPEVHADPKLALTSGHDGMDMIKYLIEKAPDFLKERGRLMFEIGHDQANAVMSYSQRFEVYRSINIIKDLNEISRVVILSI